MKIVFIVDKWSNGGVPTVMETLSHALKTLNHEVTWLFIYQGCSSQKEFNQIELNARYSGDPKVLFKIKRILDSINPDIVHDHFGGIWSVGYLYSSWKRVSVLHYHNEYEVVSDSPDDKRTLKEGLFKKILLPRYQKIVAVSSHNAQTIEKNLSNKKVDIIPNSVDLKEQQHVEKSVSNKLRIGFIGRLVFEKGVDSLIETISLMPKNDNIEVLIAGDGDENYINQLQALVKKFKLNSVRFLGRVNDKTDFFNSIDLMYFGSRQEPFGLTILEAWSHFTPIIGFYPENGGGPYELLKPGTKVGGHLLEGRTSAGLAQLIERISKDMEWVSRHTKGLNERVKQFDTNHIIQKWIRLYSEILDIGEA